MLKKITNTVLILIVFLTTTGFSVSLHYCCDSLVSMSVNSDVAPCCPVENGCCDNETQHIQLEEDLSTPLSDNIQKLDTENIFTVEILTAVETTINNKEVLTDITNSSPPGNLQQNLAKIQSFLL